MILILNDSGNASFAKIISKDWNLKDL